MSIIGHRIYGCGHLVPCASTVEVQAIVWVDIAFTKRSGQRIDPGKNDLEQGATGLAS